MILENYRILFIFYAVFFGTVIAANILALIVYFFVTLYAWIYAVLPRVAHAFSKLRRKITPFKKTSYTVFAK